MSELMESDSMDAYTFNPMVANNKIGIMPYAFKNEAFFTIPTVY